MKKYLSFSAFIFIIIFVYACNDEEKKLFEGDLTMSYSINPQMVSDSLLPAIIGHYQQLNPTDSIVAVTSQVVHEFENSETLYFHVFMELESSETIEVAMAFTFNGSSFGATTTYECVDNTCSCVIRMTNPPVCHCSQSSDFSCDMTSTPNVKNDINFNVGINIIDNIDISPVIYQFHPDNPTSSLTMDINGFTEQELIDHVDSLFYEIVGFYSLTDSITSVFFRHIKIQPNEDIHFGFEFEINGNEIVTWIGEVMDNSSTSEITCNTSSTNPCSYVCKKDYNFTQGYNYCVCDNYHNGSSGCSVAVSEPDWPIDFKIHHLIGVNHVSVLQIPGMLLNDYR